MGVACVTGVEAGTSALSSCQNLGWGGVTWTNTEDGKDIWVEVGAAYGEVGKKVFIFFFASAPEGVCVCVQNERRPLPSEQSSCVSGF